MAAPVGPSRYLVEVILVSESAVPGLTVHQRLYLNNPPDYKVSIQWISQFSGLSELWVERFGLNDATKVLNCLKCLQMLREWLHRERELYTWRGLAWLSEWVPLSLNCRSRLVYLSLIKSYDLTFDSWFRCLQFFVIHNSLPGRTDWWNVFVCSKFYCQFGLDVVNVVKSVISNKLRSR